MAVIPNSLAANIPCDRLKPGSCPINPRLGHVKIIAGAWLTFSLQQESAARTVPDPRCSGASTGSGSASGAVFGAAWRSPAPVEAVLKPAACHLFSAPLLQFSRRSPAAGPVACRLALRSCCGQSIALKMRISVISRINRDCGHAAALTPGAATQQYPAALLVKRPLNWRNSSSKP